MSKIGRSLFIIGLSISFIGIILIILSKLGIEKIPGDIIIKKGNITIFFPIISSILISLLINIILKIF